MSKTKNKYILPSIIISTFCIVNLNAPSIFNAALADDFSSIKTINPLEGNQPKSQIYIDLSSPKNQMSGEINGEVKIIKLSENDTFYQFTGATDKFVQCNIRAAWSDFKTLISEAPQNDFIYISIANKMADLGLFDLASMASSKIQDRAISQISVDAMKRFYFPRKRLKIEDELALAEIYSNILYNDQSSESTNELLKNSTLLSTSDYANYLVALGSYKSGLFSRANQYINLAIIQNPSNLNYQKLKAEILADDQNTEDAIKIVEKLKKQKLISYEYERKIKSLEQYVLYKAAKTDWEKNYHLGYYYYYENDGSKAIRTLETALSSKKKCNKEMVYALMSEIYLTMNEFEKASDTAKKAYRINKNDPKTLVSLGDLSYREKDYKQSLKYYKQAASQDKTAYTPLIKEAQSYQKLSNTKKASEIYVKILKTHSDSWEAYYNTALLDKSLNNDSDKEKSLVYLKKSLAVNPLFKDGWIELAKTEIDRANYEIAAKYLSNAFYIDENDFRYYYYQGLVDKNLGNYSQAEYNFKKCLKLNPKFEEAQKELSR